MNDSTEVLIVDQDGAILTDLVSDRDLEAAGGITAGGAFTRDNRTACEYCVVG